MQTLFPLCSVTLRRPEDEEEVDSKAAAVSRGLEYELCVQQVCRLFFCGRYFLSCLIGLWLS